MVNFPEFAVETWMDEYETWAKYNIAETCSDSISLNELLSFADIAPTDLLTSSLFTERATYGHIQGSPELRENIASMFDEKLVKVKKEDVIIAQGAIAANFLLLLAVCGAGTHVVCVDPTYQQLIDTPVSFGSSVSRWKLKKENGWLPNIDDLKTLLTPQTGLVIINNPNNPTGQMIPTPLLKDIVETIKELAAPGCVLMSDEVYRPLFHSDTAHPPVSVLELGYPHAVSTGSLSKAWSLAGVRVGWLASNDKKIIDKAKLIRDYNIISVSTFSDKIASIALTPSVRTKIIDRNIALITRNRQTVASWIKEQEGRIRWTEPNAATVGMLDLGEGVDDAAFCKELQEETGVMLVPCGRCFGIPNHVRIGYACSTETLEIALELLTPFLKYRKECRM